MGDDWLAYVAVVAATVVTVTAATAMHYEGQVALGRHFARVRMHDGELPGRRIVLKGVAGLFGLHVAEIWMFGIAYWLLLMLPDTGGMLGGYSLHLLDAVYLSAVTFTTVGFGDVTPYGPVRFLAGTEALLGLMLITWSASFTFIEMSRHWRDIEEDEHADVGRGRRRGRRKK